METRNNISCEEIRELLLEKNSGELDDPVRHHLEICRECREFHRLLIEISHSAQITQERNINPDPRIIKMLRSQFKPNSAPSRFHRVASIFEPLAAIFQKRIPAYQVMLAVFVAAIFYFSITKIHISGSNPNEINPAASVEEQTIQPVEFPVQPQTDQIHQMGKSLAEDSVTAKFRVSVL